MESFALLMAALLALGTYKVPDINPDFLSKANPEQRVELFYKTCSELMNMKAFKEENNAVDFDVLAGFAADILKNKSKEEPSKATSASDFKFQQLSKILSADKLIGFYSDVCKQKKIESYTQYQLGEAVDIYLKLNSELPSAEGIDKILPQTSYLEDRDGNLISEIYFTEGRRLWANADELPDQLIKAFVAIEDKRFFSHNGVDENGLVRAFLKSMSGSLQGGSSITQQLTKNLYFKNELEKEKETGDIKYTIIRKIKELLQTRKIESKYNKNQIINFYLNLIYLGRNSWGVKTAAKNYFNKKLKELTLSEMAFLAALPKGPNNYEPTLFSKRAHERKNLVLEKMLEATDSKSATFITSDQKTKAQTENLNFIDVKVQNNAPYFADHILSLMADKSELINNSSGQFKIKSTISLAVQKDLESALRESLAEYEISNKLARWSGPLTNISKYLNQKDTEGNPLPWLPVFKIRSLSFIEGDLEPGVILDKKQNQVTVGLRDGKTYPLTQNSISFTSGKLKFGDVVYVVLQENNKVRLHYIPKIQGAAIAMDVKNGDVIAMTGGFSFITHPFNRAIKGFTSPGSVVKPFFYVSALQKGFQPNILIPNESILISGKSGCKPWAPQNYGFDQSPVETMRYCLEHSKNLCIANLMANNPNGPEDLFQNFRSLTQELGMYKEPSQCYPLTLGAQSTSILRVAKAYSTLANGGQIIEPRFYAATKLDDKVIVETPVLAKQVSSLDVTSISQVRHMLQGVIERGTGNAFKNLSPFVAGKTGTSQSFKSTWFAGFSNQVAVVVYIAYDNNTPLNKGSTGGELALPVAAKIFESTFKNYKKPTPLIEEVKNVAFQNVDYRSGEVLPKNIRGNQVIQEAFRPGIAIAENDTVAQRNKRNVPTKNDTDDSSDDFEREQSDRDQFIEREERRRMERPRRRQNQPWWDDEGQFEQDPFFEAPRRRIERRPQPSRNRGGQNWWD